MSHTTIPSSVVSPLPVDAEHHYIRAMFALLGLLVVIAFGLITFALVRNDATPPAQGADRQPRRSDVERAGVPADRPLLTAWPDLS